MIASFHFFPFLLMYGIVPPRMGASTDGDNVLPRIHITCPGAGNLYFILSAPQVLNISSYNITTTLYV
jgi:hypothetical protein